MTSMCNGKRFAVVFNVAGRHRVMSGIGEYDVDRDLGPVLRVNLQDDEDGDNAGHQTLLVQQEALRGRVLADDQYGCDFRLEFSTTMS